MPETFDERGRRPQSEAERNPLFAAIEVTASQITGTLAMIPETPDYVKEAADAFVASLRKWAATGKEAPAAIPVGDADKTASNATDNTAAATGTQEGG